jgi:hypothetical protein
MKKQRGLVIDSSTRDKDPKIISKTVDSGRENWAGRLSSPIARARIKSANHRKPFSYQHNGADKTQEKVTKRQDEGPSPSQGGAE